MIFSNTATRYVCGASVRAGAAILRRLPSILLLAIGAGLVPAVAPAQGTPDDQTPAHELVCDGLQGAAFGLCNAYCEATDCGDGVNYASWQACASLQRNWQRRTGLDDFPCDCQDGSVFIPGQGCGCGFDLIVRVLEFRPLGCPTGQGSCEYKIDIEVTNLGSLDIVDPFSVFLEFAGTGGHVEDFPAGLPAGVSEQRLGITLGPWNNCFDPNCEIKATVDVDDNIEECDETNNTDFLVELG